MGARTDPSPVRRKVTVEEDIHMERQGEDPLGDTASHVPGMSRQTAGEGPFGTHEESDTVVGQAEDVNPEKIM